MEAVGLLATGQIKGAFNKEKLSLSREFIVEIDIFESVGGQAFFWTDFFHLQGPDSPFFQLIPAMSGIGVEALF